MENIITAQLSYSDQITSQSATYTACNENIIETNVNCFSESVYLPS